MRYLVTDELKTPFILKVLRFLRLKKPRKEFFTETSWHYSIGEVIWDTYNKGFGKYYKEVKIISKCKKREI